MAACTGPGGLDARSMFSTIRWSLNLVPCDVTVKKHPVTVSLGAAPAGGNELE